MFGKKNQNKVKVFVKSDLGDYIVYRELDKSSDGKNLNVTMWKQTETKAGWTFNAAGGLRLLLDEQINYCEVIEGQSTALKIDMQKKDYQVSQLSTDEQQRILNLKIFKAHYGNILKDLVSMIKPFLIVAIGFSVGALIAAAIGAYESYQAQQFISSLYYPVG